MKKIVTSITISEPQLVIMVMFNLMISKLNSTINANSGAHRSNNRILSLKSATQQKKLSKLVKSNISMHDPSKVIFNFSKYEVPGLR